ncbi:bifunctional UDP-N-acetylglucosamine diphosphorylase/glucosamine-1-phosphate N-acetyltransferase GlmU [Marinobacterium sp. D7]|uniref:bifunctional UDP-N-acetylglucosamine diphosphorylase/glucosamine-1-phosphate N-acetyltransferase GlmU n=1 Tax=Marinobacterium ramblicola TaxID=2849041 RepID=UPI001C2CE3EE|nr:bifunctional UDP-N-acetylglucosamine diphosphorylase/glucosamine-1-phosphate N-acetyltransferase GlmU [Marinobacterium ramblicola]MBV1790393.1 bifunctional UDP-N-acetylglucosamine diphosphorylase/glucosamine-1-phosphate N-acetyltransferase GlmU [Marinobacterium ramblicola]
MNIDVVILAAGQGSRMKSSLPKVMHALAGKPMVQHVIDHARALGEVNLHVVVGHGAQQVQDALSGQSLQFALQSEQLGTGHAVAQALPAVAADSLVLVLYGDVPLTRPETLDALLHIAAQGHLGLLTVELADPSGYGRIIRNPVGDVVAIVEHKDACEEQRAIAEVNTGIMALPAAYLHDWLPQLSSDNAQGEYYLTDVIAMAAESGVRVQAIQPGCEQEVQGVNNRAQLASLERWYQAQLAERLMADGVTLADPARIDVRGTLAVGQDISIDINCIFEGEVELGSNVRIGPNCLIRNSRIGADTQIEANTVIDGALVAGASTIGPFARLRPGTELANGVKVGNFVETKKARIGEGSKVNHLSYVGDALIGRDVNVGAGTITCNYDGVNKSLTEIGDGAFIGSNTALVAPVSVGAGATVGAGTTLTKPVADGELAVARSKQSNIRGWQRPVKRS